MPIYTENNYNNNHNVFKFILKACAHWEITLAVT